MDLFDSPQLTAERTSQPLAARMAPREWEEFIGQEHLISEGSLLRRSIETDRLGSSIFFGPPGTGKTALARLAARKSRAAIEYLNAVTAGVEDLRKVVKRAMERQRLNGQKTLLVVDEIHHFNRTQQDALLPDVERGNLTLVGLTTENPYFYVNAALVSRSTAFEFKALSEEDLGNILHQALTDAERGLGSHAITITPEAKAHILRSANGDARKVLNALELAVASIYNSSSPNVSVGDPSDGFPTKTFGNDGIIIDLAIAEASTQMRPVRYDKSGDEHYDTISAFIKSMRGSDPDAAVYWLAKMLTAGEDPRFIARRIMIFAAEDVGNADPQALSVAAAAAQIVERIGMPEARIPLAQAVTYCASAPKSNAAYMAINNAMKEVEKGERREVPNHLKDGNLDKKTRGHGEGYLYPHDFPGHHVKQEYMPNRIDFYQPTSEGFEAAIKDRLEKWRKKNPSR